MSVWEFPWLCHEGRQAGNPQITFVSSKSNTMSSRSKLTATLRVYLALELLGSSNCIDGQNLSIKKKCVWIEAKMRGSQWPMVWGLEQNGWKKNILTLGKAPVQGALTAGMVPFIVGLTLCDGPFGSTMEHTLFCLWPNRWEASWMHVLPRSWGSTGPEGGDSPKIAGLTVKMKHLHIRVIAHTLT